MRKTLSIILIDDNEYDLFLHEKFINHKNIAHLIKKYNYANDAFHFLNNTDISNWPDLILLDIHMPVMNGFEFLEKYETLPIEKQQKTQVIIVTSSLDNTDYKMADENPLILAFLTKPLNVDVVIELMKEKGVL